MSLTGGLPYVKVTSDGLSPREGLALFRDTMSMLFDVTHDSAAAAQGGFRAAVEVWETPQRMIARTFATDVLYSRSARTVARSGFDHYFVGFRPAVETADAAGFRAALRIPGYVMVIDLGYGTSTFDVGHTGMALLLARDQLDPHLTKPIPPQGVFLHPFSAAAAVIRRHLFDIVNAPFADDAASVTAIAGALAGAMPADAIARRFPAVMVTRVRRFIDAHLDQPDLSAATIIARFGISRTILYELFAPLGGVSGFIRARRLERCMALLGDSRLRHRSISDIAFSMGFNADAHFSRWFKRYHGITASDVRRAALAPKK